MVLLGCNADINDTSESGKTALERALEKNNADMIEILLAKAVEVGSLSSLLLPAVKTVSGFNSPHRKQMPPEKRGTCKTSYGQPHPSMCQKPEWHRASGCSA